MSNNNELNIKQITELVAEFHDYWQKDGKEKADWAENERQMLYEFYLWLLGRGLIKKDERG